MISLRDGMGSGWDGKFFRRRRRRRPPGGEGVGGKEVFFQEKKPPEAACWPDTWLLRKKGVIFQEKKPPEAACWPDAGLLKRKGVTSNPRIQESKKKRKIQESICKNARPRNEVFGRFWNSRMLYLDFHPMDNFSRKDFLYNKALATTLEGSRNFLGGTYSRSGCDETGGLTEIWGYIGKI